MGEINAVAPLVKQLQSSLPVVISSLTNTGLSAGRNRARCPVFRFADNPILIRHVLKSCAALVVAETELWPNALIMAGQRGVPVFLVNARVGRATERWANLKTTLRSMFAGITAVYLKDPEQARAFSRLGVDETKLRFVGGLKFDGLSLDPDSHPKNLLVFGSVRSREFGAVVKAVSELKGVPVVIAPRHTDKLRLLFNEMKRAGLAFSTRSQGAEPSAERVLIVDTHGELVSFYQRALVAFVGGSLVPGYGGHNILEPAAAGAVPVFGPHTENAGPEARGLVEAGGGFVVENPGQMIKVIKTLLSDPVNRKRASEAGIGFIRVNSGASQRIAQDILQVVSKGPSALE